MRFAVRCSRLGGWTVRAFNACGTFYFLRCRSYEDAMTMARMLERGHA